MSRHALLLLFTAASAVAADGWVDDGRMRDNVGSVQLSKVFGKKSGTFEATPESMLSDVKTISGDFLVATWRFLYDKPTGEGKGKYDELVSVDVLDCKRSYFGTFKVTRRLKGRLVSEEITPDAKINMIQSTLPSIAGQLCDLHDGKPLRHVP